LAGAGEGLQGNEKNLSAAFKRFSPTGRDVLKITKLLAVRRDNIRHSIHNFSLLSQELGRKDEDITRLIESSNVVFRAFAAQDAHLREALSELPSTLAVTNRTLVKVNGLGHVLGPTLGDLLPGARALGPSLKATRPFLRTTTPVLKNQVRPFAVDAQPTVQLLRPAAQDLAKATPKLTTSLDVLNQLFNELAYNPPGSQEGYLFWTAWTNHNGATLFATQDAHGPIRHGIVQISCTSLAALQRLGQVNEQLGTIVELLNTPPVEQVCPQTSQAGSGTLPGAAGAAAARAALTARPSTLTRGAR